MRRLGVTIVSGHCVIFDQNANCTQSDSLTEPVQTPIETAPVLLRSTGSRTMMGSFLIAYYGERNYVPFTFMTL
jgi:hypothetical protein